MKSAVMAFFSGFLFAAGLAMSGMTHPHNVIGFLDLTGVWKPALMFVMMGAVLVYAIASKIILKRPRPVIDSKFVIPDNKLIDGKLIMGGALFGVGWGLAGFCPGPAFTAMGAGFSDAAVFVLCMFLGMFIFNKVSK